MATQPPPPRRRLDPLVAIVAVVVAGVVVATLHHPQIGMWIVCAALGVGALLRLVLRERDAGSLVVRIRRLDVAVLGGLAVALGVLAAVTPFHGKG
jgi:succinate dehydrogenase/fumarate reductase cytochrome b subunit